MIIVLVAGFGPSCSQLFAQSKVHVPNLLFTSRDTYVLKASNQRIACFEQVTDHHETLQAFLASDSTEKIEGSMSSEDEYEDDGFEYNVILKTECFHFNRYRPQEDEEHVGTFYSVEEANDSALSALDNHCDVQELLRNYDLVIDEETGLYTMGEFVHSS